MHRQGSSNLVCQVYADIVGGILRYKGAVHDGVAILWEGKWRRKKADAVAETDSNAERIDRERQRRVFH